jgi:uncharacterized protein
MKGMLRIANRSRVGMILLLLSCAAVSDGANGPPAGGWRLTGESSPYLLLHADNPVEWYPWGPEALARARDENRPLFISIGYFTCHWCHVMARESFSDPAIAALLNAHFVAIKIDREQRPDIDAAYMQYVTLTSGQGGWPLSVWATPQGEPFFGGTYFPPETDAGRTGLREVLERIAAAWRDDEPGVRAVAQHAVATLRERDRAVAPVQRLTDAPLRAARRIYAAQFDELQGGFGPAPKFPEPARLLFLLEDSDPASAPMALGTLDHMLAGGIFDRLDGGFHRYSTDFEWRVPHFEKMLYDQSLMARVCLSAWRKTTEPRYADCVRDVLDFTLAGLHDRRGGFYTALAADSPVPGTKSGQAEEGAYYTWSWAQLVAALPDRDLLDWAAARYGLTPRGNAASGQSGELAGRNVLLRALDDDALAQRFAADPPTVRRRNTAVDSRLRAARQARPPVPVDDKIVTAWNGYQITTLALAGRQLDAPRYIDAARRAADFLMDKLFDDTRGVLYRDWRNGVRGVPGFQEDYAALAQGLLALYQVSGDRHWLSSAQRLVDGMRARFEDRANGGFFSTADDTELWLRDKPADDGATPSGNGVAIQVLLALGRLTGKQGYLDSARQAAAWATARLADYPAAMPSILTVWPQLLAIESP